MSDVLDDMNRHDLSGRAYKTTGLVLAVRMRSGLVLKYRRGGAVELGQIDEILGQAGRELAACL